MTLEDVDLSSVPAEHLASLASCVRMGVVIMNVSNCNVISILDNVNVDLLAITSQGLSTEDTRSLVRVMESGVDSVHLVNEVSLDIEALTQYAGEGRCRRVSCTPHSWTGTERR